MKYFQRVSIESFVTQIMQEDINTISMMDGWNMEQEEVISIVSQHFRSFGIYYVDPMKHAEVIYQSIHNYLQNSPELRIRLKKIQEEIERAKAKNSRHAS